MSRNKNFEKNVHHRAINPHLFFTVRYKILGKCLPNKKAFSDNEINIVAIPFIVFYWLHFESKKIIDLASTTIGVHVR